MNRNAIRERPRRETSAHTNRQNQRQGICCWALLVWDANDRLFLL